ncbi:MAG: beta-ketoacyl-[acyl-carrier-protein] synthase family protein, partial [Planctomycetales bacterium]
VEMVASLLAIQKGTLPPSLNYEHPDPDCPVNVVHDKCQTLAKNSALLLNQGRLGQAVAVVLAGE